MNQERYYTFVGIFVVGALSLIVFGSGFFYNEYLQAKTETYVMFFKGSLTGLEVSSTVAYRGVKIGEVRLIEITENRTRDKVEIPVYADFFVEKTFGVNHRPVQLLIDNGYVASISQPNLLTGVAQIELFQTNQPQVVKQKYYRNYPIFPTTKSIKKPTTFDETLKTAKKTLEEISTFLHSKEVQETLLSAKAMAESFRSLANKLDHNATPVLAHFTQALTSAKAMADSFENLTNKLDRNTTPVLAYFTQALTQVSKAAYSLQNVTDYIGRHPESLIRGKP